MSNSSIYQFQCYEIFFSENWFCLSYQYLHSYIILKLILKNSMHLSQRNNFSKSLTTTFHSDHLTWIICHNSNKLNHWIFFPMHFKVM